MLNYKLFRENSDNTVSYLSGFLLGKVITEDIFYGYEILKFFKLFAF